MRILNEYNIETEQIGRRDHSLICARGLDRESHFCPNMGFSLPIYFMSEKVGYALHFTTIVQSLFNVGHLTSW